MIDKQKLLNRLNEYKEAAQSQIGMSGYYVGRRDQAEWIILEIKQGDFDAEEDGE